MMHIGFAPSTQQQESKDCSVRAAANCLGISYAFAHAVLAKYGRVNCKGVKLDVLLRAYKQLGLEPCVIYGKSKQSKYLQAVTSSKATKAITFGALMQVMPWGDYVVLLKDHATCVSNRKLIDKGGIKEDAEVVALFEADDIDY